MMASDEPVSVEKTFQEWLAEALAQDEETWAAVERQLRRLRLKQADGGLGEDEPRGC